MLTLFWNRAKIRQIMCMQVSLVISTDILTWLNIFIYVYVNCRVKYLEKCAFFNTYK